MNRKTLRNVDEQRDNGVQAHCPLKMWEKASDILAFVGHDIEDKIGTLYYNFLKHWLGYTWIVVFISQRHIIGNIWL